MEVIVVPIDFTEDTDKIIQQATLLAKAFSSTLYLVHAVTPNEDISGKEVKNTEKVYPKELQQLNRLARLLREQDIETHALLVEGVTVDAILKEAESVDADLIILGSHGHNRLISALLGRVESGIVKKAKCSVLLVPGEG